MLRLGFILLVALVGIADSFTPNSPFHVVKLKSAKQSSTTALNMGLTIYGHPGSRSPLVNWACLELGVKYEMGDLSKNPHPFKQLPCMTDDGDVVVFESGAILQYIHQKHAASKMSAKAAAAVTAWIVWANASLDPICFLETDGKVYDTGLRKPNRRINRLEELLTENKQASAQKDGPAICLVPEAGFTSADVAVTSYLLYVVQFFPTVLKEMGQWPTVVEYMKEAAQRPTYAQAFGADIQEYVLDKLKRYKALDDAAAKKKLFGMF